MFQAELDALRQALADRDLRLREVDHRAKNTLQLAASLLMVRRREVIDEDTQSALEAAAGQLGSLADMHRQMYAGSGDDQVDLRPWVQAMCHALTMRSGLSVRLDVADARWPFARALPLGLFIGEAVSNSVKHARASGATAVAVTLEDFSEPPRRWRLSVADDGAHATVATGSGQGLKMLAHFASQLGGELAIGPGLEGRGFGLSTAFDDFT